MANLINLPLIDSDEDEKGREILKRLDTKEIVFLEQLEAIKGKPIRLRIRHDRPFPSSVSIPMSEYQNGADVLLLGRREDEGNIQYCTASFYTIKKKE